MILTGDCLEILPTLEAESVQCCVTSPPYYGLRDYGTATWQGGDPGCGHIDEVAAAEQRRNRKGLANNADENDGATRSREVQNGIDKAFQYKTSCPKCGATRIDSQIGLEDSPGEYVEKLVAVFREVRRVLRDDGTVWLNLGDSYARAGGYSNNNGLDGVSREECRRARTNAPEGQSSQRLAVGLKEKDLIGIPWRVAFALQADGWYLRQDIIWAKPNPMPESVTDRCTKAHEYIFLLTKSARYFYDAEAVKEKVGEEIRTNKTFRGETVYTNNQSFNNSGVIAAGINTDGDKILTGRNRRSVWTITTKPFREAHFAVFPPEIPEICIKAGTSLKGCCPECGNPWERVVQKSGGTIGKGSWIDHSKEKEQGMSRAHGPLLDKDRPWDNGSYEVKTLGWRPTCTHNLEPIPCTILDPFSGAGTTGNVAERLGRKYIGIELNPAYAEMGERRIEAVSLPLFQASQ